MSYVVLARKWRPESFREVVGQRHVVLTIAAAIETARIAHAYLFTGPRGVGKTTVARILAKALNCEKGPTPEPCGVCASCEEIARGKGLDVIEIDGASNRKIEDARGIRETVQYAPLSGRTKVYIIDEAHMLTREAFNALLKTLEEPPPHVVFILATTEPGKIPETIASRCQRFDFHRIAVSDIEARLREIAAAEKIDVEEDALGLLAARSDGSMRDAESLLDQLASVRKGKVSADDVSRVLGIPDTDVFFAITDAIASRDPRATLAALAAASDAGFDARDLLDGLVGHLRNLLLLSAAPSPERLGGRTAGYAGRRSASSSLGEDELVRLLRLAVDVQAAARLSTQPTVLVELALVRMARLSRTVEIDDVLKALGGDRRPREPGGSGAATGSAPTAEGRRSGPPPDERGASRPGDGEEPGRAEGVRIVGLSGGRSANASDVGRWPEILERLRSERPGLAASLNDAIPRVVDGGALGILVPNGSPFHKDQLEDRANMRLMERAASDVLGKGVRIDLTFGVPARPVVEAGAGESRAASDTTDPTVRRVLEMFGGELRPERKSRGETS